MNISSFHNRARSESGQSMTEFTLVLPALALVLFAIIQFGIVFKDYLALTDAVRAGSRKATVSRLEPEPLREEKTEAAVKAAAPGLDPARLIVDVDSTWEPGEPVKVIGRYPYSINLLGKIVADGYLTSEISERVE